MEKCPNCGGKIIGVEYGYGNPNRYDGISEWACDKCCKRWGRWSGKELAEGEQEPRYGRKERIIK